jgi:hypothetical protein
MTETPILVKVIHSYNPVSNDEVRDISKSHKLTFVGCCDINIITSHSDLIWFRLTMMINPLVQVETFGTASN